MTEHVPNTPTQVIPAWKRRPLTGLVLLDGGLEIIDALYLPQCKDAHEVLYS